MDKEINPIVEDCDFFCSREKCPAYRKSGWEQYEPSTCDRDGKAGVYCILAFRQELMKYKKFVEEDLCETCGHGWDSKVAKE